MFYCGPVSEITVIVAVVSARPCNKNVECSDVRIMWQERLQIEKKRANTVQEQLKTTATIATDRLHQKKFLSNKFVMLTIEQKSI